MSQNSTRMVYVAKLVDVLARHGESPKSVLRAAGLSTHNLSLYDQRISLNQYVAAIEAACSLLPLPDLGFQVGFETGLEEHGVLGFALLSASTFRGSLSRYLRYQHLQGPLMAIAIEQDSDRVSMVARPSVLLLDSPAVVGRFVVQEWLASWNQWAPLIGVGRYLFSKVELELHERTAKDCYTRYLNCSVSFDQQTARAQFPVQHLDCPLDFGSQQITTVCDEQCKLIVEELNLGHGLVAEILRLLATRPGVIPRMDHVAGRLHMDPRTLRRQLKREGKTYQELILQFRLALARRYLRESALPANEIASLVGYADPANLYRTFASLMGLSPQEYREQHTITTSSLTTG